MPFSFLSGRPPRPCPQIIEFSPQSRCSSSSSSSGFQVLFFLPQGFIPREPFSFKIFYPFRRLQLRPRAVVVSAVKLVEQMVRKKSPVEEDTSSSRSRTTVKGLKEIKDSSSTTPSRDIYLRSKKSRGDATLLRRSPRGAERLEKQNVPSPLKKTISEREVKKESERQLRRSGKIKKACVFSSKSSGSSENKKMGNLVNSGKNTSVSVTPGEHKSKNHKRSATPLSKKRKMMDARNYRREMVKKSKIPDSSETSHDYDSRADDSTAMSDGGDECHGRKCDELSESVELCLEGPKEYAMGSSLESGELRESGPADDGNATSACFNMMQKHAEPSQSQYADSVANLQCTLVGETSKEKKKSNAEKKADGDVNAPVVCKTRMEDLGALKPKEFSSQYRSIAHDFLQETGAISPGLSSSNSTCGIDCDPSVPSNDKNIEVQAVPTTDACPFSPSTTMENLEQCRICSIHQRAQDLQARDSCSCDQKTTNNLFPSSFKEGHEKFASDKHAANFMEDDVSKGDLVSETKSQIDRAEKSSFSVASVCTTKVDALMEETRTREEFSCMDIAKGDTSSTLLKEPLFEIQTDCGPTKACVVCKKPETELSCGGKGCNTCCHLSCLDPPLQSNPPGVWMCIFCIKRKIEFGVYSVSEGIESVWNVKEGQNGKDYLVKYKGLAHAHNQWVSETQLLLEAPTLLNKFNRNCQKNKVNRWNQEWTEPHRLLQKRSLMSQKLADDFFDGLGDQIAKCYCEWFVKWKGLGYEDATWELESSPFLCTPMAKTLMKDYEIRVNATAAFDSSNADKALEFKRNSFHTLTRLSDGHPTTLDNDHLDSINRLREFWHRNQNTLLIDAQERVTRSILFVLSILSYACRPFLIISLAASLCTWETELTLLAPFINFVIYKGSKDVRRMIRDLEFYEKGGRIMFQVLLSHPDVVIEDLEALEGIGWEAVFVDECQNSRTSKHLEVLKHLSTGFRLLLLGGQLKDSAAEYLNLLSFLDPGLDSNSASNVDSPINDPAGNLALLKERLSRYVSYERKPGPSKFLEYWVPVRLSNVQLEQYCFMLMSKSIPLRSCSKTDLVGALPDTLFLTKKCCDHPYLVDENLQSSLVGNFPAPILDIGINASGKLQLLDKILQMVQNQGSRVLILFQSIGRPGRTSLGDILDDAIRQRFGENSYERVDRGLTMSRRLSAMNNFNDRARGRFIFLIESRACLPSIKLSSVDIIIIYNSDWNPLNDIRSLQKITIESPLDRIAVFRLYSSFTVEEKSLIFAKENIVLYNNIENLSPSVCQSLLTWGASYLFHQLDDFHQLDNSDICTQGGTDKTIDDVLEILTKLPACPSIECSVVVEAPQNGASYSGNIILIGEKEGASSVDKDPCSFWSSLLDGRYPQWRHITESSCSHRSRRKVHNLSEPAICSEPEYEEVKKRQKKTVTGSEINSSENWVHGRIEAEGRNAKAAFIPNSSQMETDMQPTSHGNVSSYISPISDGTSDDNPHEIELEGRHKLRTAQRSFHLLLKPEVAELCEILKFPENVKDMAQVFLDYIMNNHHVSPEPEIILQAFKISLCWRAASFLKHKIDHKESLALAKKYLKFTCNEQQVSIVYKKLKILKKFLRQNSSIRSKYEQNSSASNHNRIEKVGLEENSQSQNVLEQLMLPEQGEVPAPVTPADLQGDLGSSKDELVEKEFHLINKICSKREEQLLHKQQKEMSDFNMNKEKLELSMKKAHDRVLELINDVVLDPAEKDNKVRLFKEEFFKKMAAFGKLMDCQCQRLKNMQSVARDKEQQLKNHWLEEVKAGKLPESVDNIPLSDSGFILEQFVTVDNARDGLGDRLISGAPGHPQSEQTGDPMIISDLVTSVLGAKNSELCRIFSPGGAECPPSRFGKLVSQSDSMDQNRAFGSGEMPLEVPSNIKQPEAADIHMEPEASASGMPIMNLATNEANATAMKATTFATEKQGVADNTGISCLGSIPSENIEQGRHTDYGEGACSTSSLTLNQADSPSLVPSITSIGCENVLPSQEPRLNGNESLGNSADMENQGNDILEETPALDMACCGTSQVELPTNCTAASDSFNNSSPVWRVSSAVENQGSIPVSGIEEPSTQTQSFSQPNVNTMQEAAVAPFSLLGQSNINGLVPQCPDHSVLSNSEIRFHSINDDLTSTSIRPESVRYPLFPLTHLMPTQGFQSEPLKNELTRIRLHEDRITKMHDDRKLQLKLMCEEEIEKIRKKYDMLLQDAESEFIQNKEILETIYYKVLINQLLAEEFRAKFIENKGGASSSSQGPRALQQILQSSQPQFVQRSASPTTFIPTPLPATTFIPAPLPATTFIPAPLPATTFIPAPLPATTFIPTPLPATTFIPTPLPATLTSATVPNSHISSRPRAPPSPVCSGPTVHPTSPVFPSNFVRPHFSSMLPPRANLKVGSEARAPAPHLQRFRANASSSSQSLRAHTSAAAALQHPHPPNAGSATMRQITTCTSTRPCVVPMNGTGPPIFSNTISVSRDANQTNAQVPLNVGDTRGEANKPNMPQMADFDRWLSSNVTMASSELPQTGVDGHGPSTNSNEDVVCISDDE